VPWLLRVRVLEHLPEAFICKLALLIRCLPAAPVSQNGDLLSRRGRSLPASVSGFDTHRASISRRFDGRATSSSTRRTARAAR
jgi:hypothetical protein